MRVAVFFASMLAAVAAIGGLNWWVDPFADRYQRDAVDAAFAGGRHCLISQTVVGERTWTDFKLDLVRRRDARTVVVGTSRVWKLGARSENEPFANLALPGMGIETLNPLFRRLAATHRGPLTIELGLEEFWLSPQAGQAFFDQTVLDDARVLLSGETLRKTVTVLSQAPGAIRHPRALRPWHVVPLRSGCLVDRGDSVLNGAANVWGPDGTWQWQWDVTGQAVPSARRYVVTHRKDFIGSGMDRAKLQILERALAYARARRWRVVAFAPPYTPDSLAYLRDRADTASLLRDFHAHIAGILGAEGVPFLDLSDVRDVPCDPRRFTWNDGAHADDRCGRRIRQRIERFLQEGT